MRIPHVWEPEETVGGLWHRAADGLDAAPRFAQAAMRFETQRTRLGVFFRGLGGAGGIEMRPIADEVAHHRLGFLRRLGRDTEKVTQARFDGAVLGLPEVIDLYPEAALNADLYLWLAALTAFAGPPVTLPKDPLRRDAARLAALRADIASTLAAAPGLRALYQRLCVAALALRRLRRLPAQELATEQVVRFMLGAGEPDLPLARALLDAPSTIPAADVGYRPFRPVALWPLHVEAPVQRPRADRDDEAGSGGAEGGSKSRKAERRAGDQADRRDSLVIHRFEHILSWAEYLNIARPVEDADEDEARKAADDLDIVSVVKNRKKAAIKLKFDLDLAPQDVALEKLSGVDLVPEWDFRAGLLRAGHCRILSSLADEAPQGLVLDASARRRIAMVKKRFEALRPKRAILPRQIDGVELDLDAAVRAAVDLRSSGEGSDRVWRRTQNEARDLAVEVLVDTSRSTEGLCGERPVLDIAREALVALAEGISGCGDDLAIHGFSSLRRDRVYVRQVKGFGEAVGPAMRARIAGLKPGFYTRIGAALRHVAKDLAARPNRKKLLIVLTDGKPNDLDHYEGRYGIEDTRHAVMEARRQQIAVFGVTVDRKAQHYFPYMFGANGFAIVPRPERLGEALAQVWQHLVD
jgi:nitric oxide reductase NorD protein